MDKLGNRTSVTLRDTSTETYTVDNQTNQYTQIGAAALSYDAAGNLTTDPQGYRFEYDYENRLTEVYDVTDLLVAAFDYDALGRRCKKVDYSLGDPNDPNSGAATYYFYDTRYQVLAEKTAVDQTLRWYVYGNQMDERLIMMTDTAAYYYIANHLGSTVALTDATGTVVERYDYDVYGKPYFYDANDVLLATQASTVDNPYLYTSRELDNLDNGNLPLGYHRNRYLHYRFASWLTPDPLGIKPNARMGNEKFVALKQYQDGLNYYEYVGSNSINIRDEYGLISGPYGPVCGPGNSWVATWIPDMPLGLVDFTKPCQLHDDCYGCNPEEKYKHRRKSYCDKLFLIAMQLECDKQYPVFWVEDPILNPPNPNMPSAPTSRDLRQKCYTLAEIYYQAVRTERWGVPAFDEARKNTCCTKEH